MKKTIALIAGLLLAGVCTGCGTAAENSQQGLQESISTTTAAEVTAAAGAQETDTSAEKTAAGSTATTASDAAAVTEAGNSAQSTAAESGSDAGSTAAKTTAAEEQKIGSKTTIGIQQKVKAKAGEQAVPVTLHLWNNPGFMGMGMRLDYDPALKPKTEDGDVCTNLVGEAAENMLTTCLVDESQHLIAFATMASKPETIDGDLVTVYFDIPADAASGTEYPLLVEVVDFADGDKQPVKVTSLSSAIVVE